MSVEKAIKTLSKEVCYRKNIKPKVYKNESIYLGTGFKFYHKFPEITLASNRDICKEIGIDKVQETKNILRCEKRYGSFKKLRTAFYVKGDEEKKWPFLTDILQSKEKVNYNSFKKIQTKQYDIFNVETGDMTLTQIEKYYGRKYIIETCDFDINVIAQYLQSKTKGNIYSRHVPLYKGLIMELQNDKKERETNKGIITDIENQLLNVERTCLDSIKVKFVDNDSMFKMKKDMFKQSTITDYATGNIVGTTLYLKNEINILGLKSIKIKTGNETTEKEIEIEMTAKALKDRYLEGLTENNFHYALSNMESDDLKINKDLFLDNAIACYVDCTDNLKIG